MSGLGTRDEAQGIAYIFDETRNKFLSVTRTVVQAGTEGHNIVDRYLGIAGVPSIGEQGFLLPRAATVTGIWAKSRNASQWKLEVRRNGELLKLEELTVVGGKGQKLDCDVDLEPGDWLQVFASGSGIQFPIAAVEFAWTM